MKSLLRIFLLLTLLITATAEAQSYRYSRNYPAPPRVAPATPSVLERRLFVSVLYSTADQLKYKGTVDLFGGSTAFNATETSSSALGLAGGYISRRENSFGYSADVTYELPRTSKGLQGSAGGLNVTGTYDKSPAISLIALGFNANYSLGRDVYFFGGLNYPFSSGQSGTLSGQPGYQIGGGYAFTDRISLEAGYRLLKFSGAIDSPPLNLKVKEATLSGLVLGLQYHF